MAVPYTAPSVSVWIAPGFGPLTPPSTSDWDELTIGGATRLVGFSMRRGRDDILDAFPAASAALTLDSTDRQLDELFPGGLLDGVDTAWMPVQVRAFEPVTSTTRVLWSGYATSGFEPADDRGDRVRVTCTDWLGWAAEQPMPGTIWSTWLATAGIISGARPAVWWRGRARYRWTGSNYTDSRVFGDGSAAVDAVPLDDDAMSLSAPLLTGDETPGMRLWDDKRLASTAGMSTTKNSWVFSCQFKVRDLGSSGVRLATGRTGSATGSPRWQVRISPATGSVVAEVFDAGGTQIGQAIASAVHNDYETHCVVAVFSKTFGSVDVVTDLASGTAGISGTAAGSGGYIVLGQTASARVLIDEAAYLEELLDGSISPEFLALMMADPGSYEIHPEDTLAARLGRVMATGGVAPSVWAAWPTPTGRARKGGPTATTTCGPMLVSANLADAVMAVGESTGGAAYTLRDGTVRVRSAGDLLDLYGANAAAFWAWSASLTDDHAPDPAWFPPVRYSGRGRSGRLAARVVNEVHSAGGTPAFDAPSQAKYGRRPLDLAATCPPSEVGAIAQDLIDARKDPTYVLDEVTIRPWGDQRATRFVLADVELEKPVEFTQYTPDGATALIDHRPMRISAESWSWDGGTDWSVTLRLVGDPDPVPFPARINYSLNPSFEVDLTGWTGDGSSTFVRAASGGTVPAELRGNCGKVTWSSGNTHWITGTLGLGSWAVGDVISITAWMTGTTGLLALVAADIAGGGVIPLASAPLSGVTPSASTLTRVTGSYQITATTTGIVKPIAQASGLTSGEFRVHAVLVEKDLRSADYFDGATTPGVDSHVLCGWHTGAESTAYQIPDPT